MSNISCEQDILEFWQNNNIYGLVKSKEKDIDDTNEFVFMDGPPFVSATNLHHGHIFIGSLKDTVLRYQRMHGKKCQNQLGFDTHGLPTESACMKRLGLSTNNDIEKYGIANFNEECIKMINEFTMSWEPIYNRCGRWCDFNNVYKTLDKNFMESVWWSFKELHKKGLIYQGYKVMPYSWKLETPLSNFEAGQSYKEINTTSIYVTFDLVSNSNTKFVAWTTTPWTLPSNLALCVNPNANYMKCTTSNGISYIVGENYINNLKTDFISVELFGKGVDLIGLEYIPLFDFLNVKFHKILADLYVKDSSTIGTGIVHLAPCYGDDDCRVCMLAGAINNKNLDQLCAINSIGEFLPIIKPYAGMLVFDSDKLIVKDLMNNGKGLLTQMYKHNYAFCERSNTPLISKTCSSVFVEVTKIKKRMIELNDKIIWSRPEIGQNRFKNWLEQTIDWALSRNRNFGTPIPLWQTDDGEETIVIGSIQELMELAKLTIAPNDLHTHHIDSIVIISPNSGKPMRRIKDVFDCWFESGSAIFAKLHYPFENSTYFDNKEYLSDFVAEGSDQTRGWFYTLLVLSTALFNKPPFKHCICSGLILDENGVKFSKKIGNFIDPILLLEKYGSDVLRLYLEKSHLSNSQELFFKELDVIDVGKKLIPYTNGVAFFIDHFINARKSGVFNIEYIGSDFNYDTLTNVTDKWILERISNLREYVEIHMDDYHVDKPVLEILNFIEDLTNWYIKFNRLRMKGKNGKTDQYISLSVLYTVLYEYMLISAPFMPFMSEHIYKQLKKLGVFPDIILSVHMLRFPNVNRKFGIEQSFKKLQTLCSLIRAIRDKSTTHTSTKIPIELCIIYEDDINSIDELQKLLELIQDEINCVKFEFQPVPIKSYSLKPIFNVIGKKYKKDSQNVAKIISSISSVCVSAYIEQGSKILGIINDDNIYEFSQDDFEIIETKLFSNNNSNMVVKESNGLLLAVDLTISKEGTEKYLVKCFCKEVQNIRKEMGLKQWDKIILNYYTESEQLKNCLEKHINKLLELSDNVNYKYIVNGNICKVGNYNCNIEIHIQTKI